MKVTLEYLYDGADFGPMFWELQAALKVCDFKPDVIIAALAIGAFGKRYCPVEVYEWDDGIMEFAEAIRAAVRTVEERIHDEIVNRELDAIEGASHEHTPA